MNNQPSVSYRNMFDYANPVYIIPLGTEYIQCIFQLPEEAATCNEQLTNSLKIDGGRYTYSVK